MANQIESICIGPMSEEALKELVERAVPVSLSASKEADYFLWLGSTRDFSVDIVRRPTLERLEARALPRELRFALGVGLVYPREHRDSAVRAAARVVAALVREHDADLVWLRRGDMIGLVRCDGEVFIDERRIPDTWTMPKSATHGNVSSLFMPRWASRILLEITGVRVERLQAITEDDVRAEGVDEAAVTALLGEAPPAGVSLLELWRLGWDAINRERAAWSADPYVWVLSFRRAPTEDLRVRELGGEA